MASRKVSDGLSVRVTVPQSTVIPAGSFARIGGVLGYAPLGVTTGVGETKPLILSIERCEYETTQIDSADTFAVGAKVFWDNANKRFTEVDADGFYAGFVTSPKGSGTSIWLIFEPDQYGVAGQGAAVADITTADGTDLPTTQALANATKARVNTLLASLRAAGIIATE